MMSCNLVNHTKVIIYQKLRSSFYNNKITSSSIIDRNYLKNEIQEIYISKY